MEVELSVVALCAAAFFLAGFVDSVAGGGGLISVPALLLCGVPPHFALGSGKVSASLGSLVALWTYARGRLICSRIVPAGIVSAFAGGVLGSGGALLLESDLLGRVIVFMLPVGLVLSLACGGLKLTEGEMPERGLIARVAAAGLAIGAYDGFFGPGAGSFFLISLHVLIRMGLVRASANAKVLNLASCVGSACTFAAGGVVCWTLALPCAAASIAGNRLGSKYAMKFGPRLVRTMLYGVLALLFASLLYRFFLQGQS